MVSNKPIDEITPEIIAYTTIDDDGECWYITESKELRYVQRGFFQSIRGREEGLRVLLFDIRTKSKWCQGMDGIESELEITAYLIDEFGKPDTSLWTIHSRAQTSAHEFWSGCGYNTNVYAFIKGCGGPSTCEVYDLCTGKLVGLDEEVGSQPSIKWATKK